MRTSNTHYSEITPQRRYTTRSAATGLGLLALFSGCGVEYPPGPPLAPPADAYSAEQQLEPAEPAEQDQNDKKRLPPEVISASGKQRLIPERYIVTFKKDFSAADSMMSHIAATTAALGIRPTHVYTSALQGFAAPLDTKQLAALQQNPQVERIEPDQEVGIDSIQSMDLANQPWGLDRIDQRVPPLSKTFSYRGSGAGVTAYVIDSGIAPTHPDFGGRARIAFDALGGTGLDCNGHGTHVAGTIGGTTYGVAKSAALRGVRVLDCGGAGSVSATIAGVDWVRAHHVKPAVANLSLSGGYSPALNAAVQSLSGAGVFVSVSAGNAAADACAGSPASASGVYAVAASDRSDAAASFSNHGACVDAYAPGVDIRSAWPGGGSRDLSGTSMAAPHVAGVVAIYKGDHGDASQATLTSWLNLRASKNVITSIPAGTPNRLLFLPQWILEFGIDRPGGDYRSFNLSEARPELCLAECAADSACQAYTYLVPGAAGPLARCSLKSASSSPVAKSTAVSGARTGTERDVDRPGMDYRSFDLTLASPRLCEQFCEREAQCEAYTYIKPGVLGPNARCRLKSGVPEPTVASFAISGVKQGRDFGMNRAGADFQIFSPATPEPSQCQAACARTAECQSYAYVPPGIEGPSARCRLKSEVAAATPSQPIIAGIKGVEFF